ncbi:MAG: TetR/AcrR family transcriptional regulator [Alphaproteobacteria bacterium]|nr:TetR/AcrR family transcriptional regulator [Alphaproteobacteria bacterium]
MPKISDARRAERREQILNAAWTCFQREGLHATTMDDIIVASGLSAGAVYRYFPSKEDLIVAAVTTSLSGIRALLDPLLLQDPLLPPQRLLEAITAAIDRFSARDGFDLKRLALLGWSEAQRNERLRATMLGFYAGFRSQLADACRAWIAAGMIPRAAAPEEVAKALLALILGFVVQAAILGDVDPASVARGAVQLGVADPGALPYR